MPLICAPTLDAASSGLSVSQVLAAYVAAYTPRAEQDSRDPIGPARLRSARKIRSRDALGSMRREVAQSSVRRVCSPILHS